MRPWGIAIAFVLCASEMQRLWGDAEGWVFLGLTLMTALVWIGEERGLLSVHPLADHIVEITVGAILLAGVALPLIRGGEYVGQVFFQLELWAPLICAWWGLSSGRLNTRRLAVVALAFFFVLHWGLEQTGGHIADEKVIILAAVIVLTRHWALVGTGGRPHATTAQTPPFLDAATGVYARPYFEAELMHMGAVANRYHQPFSLIAIRLDGYRELLSRIGPDALREMERKAAWLIAERIRAPDSAAHWSDGRFLVLLPSTEQRDGLQLAANLRRVLTAATMGTENPASFSCGVAQHQYGDDPMTTVATAEAQLGEDPRQPPPTGCDAQKH